MKDNKLYFTEGGICAYYNKPITSVVNMECGFSESFVLSKKVNGCHYEFIYTTKMACNTHTLEKLKRTIKNLKL
jgi:hypothetical protein